ncbi:hypothetical protein CC2G_005540 [Coprinopsis cinerea AmutBmut pab1-1]|nr:hypothetical protein CC2G_005540 [Coprinopsis cinerea AmutBmut pab1-1]
MQKKPSPDRPRNYWDIREAPTTAKAWSPSGQRQVSLSAPATCPGIFAVEIHFNIRHDTLLSPWLEKFFRLWPAPVVRICDEHLTVERILNAVRQFFYEQLTRYEISLLANSPREYRAVYNANHRRIRDAFWVSSGDFGVLRRIDLIAKGNFKFGGVDKVLRTSDNKLVIRYSLGQLPT